MTEVALYKQTRRSDISGMLKMMSDDAPPAERALGGVMCEIATLAVDMRDAGKEKAALYKKAIADICKRWESVKAQFEKQSGIALYGEWRPDLIKAGEKTIQTIGAMREAVALMDILLSAIEHSTINCYYRLPQNEAQSHIEWALASHVLPDKLSGSATVVGKDFTLTIGEVECLRPSDVSTAGVLLKCLLIKATEKGLHAPLTRLPLKEYMAMCGLANEAAAREQIKRAIEVLKRVYYAGKIKDNSKGKGESRGKNRMKDVNVYIFGGTEGEYSNGDIIFRFNDDYVSLFRTEADNFLHMHLPAVALERNRRQHPYTLCFARHLTLLKLLDREVVTVGSLIKACPCFPSDKGVRGGNRNFTVRRIEPFERDMNAMAPTVTWEYEGGKRPPYEDWEDTNIIVKWAGYPGKPPAQLEVVEANQAQKTTVAVCRFDGSGVQIRR